MTARTLLLIATWTLLGVARCAADSLQGQVLDVPRRYSDGSVRFHVLPAGQPLRKWEPASDSASGPSEPIRFSDRFEGGRSERWLDVVGKTEARDSTLRSVTDGSVSIVDGLVDAHAVVRVRAKHQLQFGIVMRYADTANYVLAFFEPVQGIIAVHERRDGQFGPHVASTKVEGLAAGPIVLETTIAGAELRVLLRDSQGTEWKTDCRLATLVRPGVVGVYCDQAAAKGAQEFDDFEVETYSAEESAADPAAAQFAVLPVGNPQQQVLLFRSEFDEQDAAPFATVLGEARQDNGRLRLRGDRVIALAKDVQLQNGMVSVTGDSAMQFGVVLRYQDVDNYLLAFYSPTQQTIGVHERRDGEFGAWIASRTVPPLTARRVRLTATADANAVHVMLTDDHDHAYVCSAPVQSLLKAGSVGVYFDTAAKVGEQQLDHFQVTTTGAVMQDDAVQVIVPSQLCDDQMVWNLGQHITVEGTSAVAISSPPLRALAVESRMALNTSGADSKTMFPTRTPAQDWVRFPALGFAEPVTGVIYRRPDRVVNGVALGGLDTGCLDLESSGLWGYSTLFNSHVPRSGPHNEPVLGLHVGGRTWTLCDPAGSKAHSVSAMMAGILPGDDPRLIRPASLPLHDVSVPAEIHYFGHYPVADLEFETDAPVSVGLRAWAPFLPGDEVGSMMPALFLEVHIRNTSQQGQQGTVAVNFPGPLPAEADALSFERTERVSELMRGVQVSGRRATYVLGAIGEDTVRTGGGLGVSDAAWAKIGTGLPLVTADNSSASAAVDFNLAVGEQKTVRFVAAWSAPQWHGGGNWGFARQPQDGVWGQPLGPLGTYTHMYARYWPDAWKTAESAAQNYDALQRRVLAWQAEVFNDLSLPAWLREGLINILYLITETGVWAQVDSSFKPEFRPEDGLFGMCESPRACPQIECIPCSFYGNVPLVYFFPRAALSTLRGYKNYQDAEGSPPWVFGPAMDLKAPGRGYQVTMNPACYTEMVSRYWRTHGNQEFLQEFYPSIKKAAEFTLQMNRAPGGIIAMPDRKLSAVSIGGGTSPETEWFEFLQWYGYATHSGGVKLAQLRTVAAMARAVGDGDFAATCDRVVEEGMHCMEDKLWVNDGGYYRNFLDEAGGRRSDHIFAYQLDGEWMTRFQGVPGVFPPDRVATVLQTVREKNVPHTRYGAVNLVNPDGSIMAFGGFPLAGFYEPYDFFTPELFMLSMTYVYAGERTFGLELGRRCQQNIALEQGMTWDGPNVIRGNTGERGFGNDYYQNMIMWAYPAALAGGDISAPAQPGGLIHRVLRAARAE